jgi:glycosyltransferase involved in cell wall biosynthesis
LKKRISVIIPSLHSKMIDKTIDSVKNQTYDLADVEIIVVGLDQHGLVKEDENVKFISTGQPVGPATARNIGIDASQGEYLFFLDADCLATKDWLRRLMGHHDKGIKVVGGSVAFDTNNYWMICDNVASFCKFLSSASEGRRRYLPTINFSARKDIILRAGKFDESFTKPAGEDVDLSIKIRLLGYELHFEPKAIVYHYPERGAFKDGSKHLFTFGEVWAQIRLRYPHVFKDSFPIEPFVRRPNLLLPGAPLVALYNILKDFSENPAFIKYWYAIPGIFILKMVWCLGLVRGLKRARLRTT